MHWIRTRLTISPRTDQLHYVYVGLMGVRSDGRMFQVENQECDPDMIDEAYKKELRAALDQFLLDCSQTSPAIGSEFLAKIPGPPWVEEPGVRNMETR